MLIVCALCWLCVLPLFCAAPFQAPQRVVAPSLPLSPPPRSPDVLEREVGAAVAVEAEERALGLRAGSGLLVLPARARRDTAAGCVLLLAPLVALLERATTNNASAAVAARENAAPLRRQHRRAHQLLLLRGRRCCAYRAATDAAPPRHG